MLSRRPDTILGLSSRYTHPLLEPSSKLRQGLGVRRPPHNLQPWTQSEQQNSLRETRFLTSSSATNSDEDWLALDLLLRSSPESLFQTSTDCCFDLPHDNYLDTSTYHDHVLYRPSSQLEDSNPQGFFDDILRLQPPPAEVWNQDIPTTSAAGPDFSFPMDMTSLGSGALQPSPPAPPFPPARDTSFYNVPLSAAIATASPRSNSDGGQATTNSRNSPSSTGDSGNPTVEVAANRIVKRQRNTEAARRYRQRKVDRVTELEEALQAMSQERDDLRLKLARAEAEADTLRKMVGK